MAYMVQKKNTGFEKILPKLLISYFFSLNLTFFVFKSYQYAL